MIPAPGLKSAPTTRRSIQDQLTATIFIVAGLGLLGLFWTAACNVPGIPWNAARLAPSFALAYGLPIYALQSSGAQLGWIYGPVFPIWFLPATIPGNLTASFMLAAGWNILTILAPVYGAARAALGSPKTAGLITLLGASLLVSNPITREAFYMLHVDSTCIACGVVAAIAVLSAVSRGSTIGLHLSVLAVVLAVWTKQTAIALVPAVVFWLWTKGSRRLALSWLWWLLIYGGAVSLGFSLFFGSEELWFNLWVCPIHNPMAGGVGRLGFWLTALLTDSWLWWLGLATVLAGVRKSPRPILSPSAGAMVSLLCWMAAWQLPLGLFATLKVGGALNSFHSLVYGLVAGLIIIGALVQAQPDHIVFFRMRTAMTMGAVSIMGVAAGYWLTFHQKALWSPYRGQEELLALAKSRPGGVYLPWNPLVTIISDRRIYPFDDALLCLAREGLEPPREAIARAVPSTAVVLYQEPSQSKFALHYFGAEARQSAH